MVAWCVVNLVAVNGKELGGARLGSGSEWSGGAGIASSVEVLGHSPVVFICSDILEVTVTGEIYGIPFSAEDSKARTGGTPGSLFSRSVRSGLFFCQQRN